jgi:hypothetical protein
MYLLGITWERMKTQDSKFHCRTFCIDKFGTAGSNSLLGN